MGEFVKKPPLVVEQTSAEYMGEYGQEAKDILSKYSSIYELSSEAEEAMQDGDAVSNLYNEHYGKAAINLPDVIKSVSRKKMSKMLNVKFGKSSTDEEKAARNSAINSISETIAKRSYRIELRQLEYAYDDFIKQFKTAEDLKTHEVEGGEDFLELKGEMQNLYEKEILATLEREGGIFKNVSKDEMIQLAHDASAEAMRKEYERTRGKIAESRAFLKVLDRYSEDFSNIEEVIDMAGGAGDLGILFAESFEDKKMSVRIVDVVPALEQYAIHLKQQGIKTDTDQRVSFELHPLQETVIRSPKTTAIIAKHPCGGLKDDIVNLGIEHGVSFIAMMTCCQDKMCKHAEEYFQYYQGDEIKTKEEFVIMAKRSAATNIDLEDIPEHRMERARKKYEEGVIAMNKLDEISVERLRKNGYSVDILSVDDPLVKKGNMIIARKIINK